MKIHVNAEIFADSNFECANEEVALTHRCYATICIYHDDADPNSIGAVLGLLADRTVCKGDIRIGHTVPRSGWFWGTKDKVDSDDLIVHIDWLYQTFDEKKAQLHDLRRMGYDVRMTIFWESSDRNGGPVFPHATGCDLSGIHKAIALSKAGMVRTRSWRWQRE